MYPLDARIFRRRGSPRVDYFSIAAGLFMFGFPRALPAVSVRQVWFGARGLGLERGAREEAEVVEPPCPICIYRFGAMLPEFVEVKTLLNGTLPTGQV
jgi:hypothetical protein